MEDKNRLFIDASLKSLTIVLTTKDKSVSAYDDKPKETLEQMFPLITSLCKECNIKYKNIDEIYSTTGPGSTTGIRMSLTQARVFFALKPQADLYGASTLDVLYKASNLNDALVILSDRHNTLFYALYKNGNKVDSGHANSLEDIKEADGLTIIYASNDTGASQIIADNKSLSIPLSKALTTTSAYRKYTPDNVDELVPLYTEKI